MSASDSARALRWVGLALAFSLSACAPWVRTEQPNADPGKALELRAGETAGQTFVAYFAGLDGVDVFLWPGAPGAGVVRLHLQTDPEAEVDLAQASLPLETVTTPGFYRFTFAVQPDSFKRTYYGALEVEGEGSLRLGVAPDGAYLDGALHQGGRPVDAQLTFNLVYEPVNSLLGLAGEMVSWLGMMVVGVLLFVLPGWALLAWVWPEPQGVSWAGQAGLATGLSLALYPLLLLFTHLVGLQLGAGYAWGPVIVAAAGLLWRLRGQGRASMRRALAGWRAPEVLWPNLALLAVLGLAVAVRFWMIRTLDVPLWGDSVHHTMIAQLLVDNGGLFESWRPYAELDTFTYHFGFHAAAAAVHWITGLALPQAVLWTGQLLNVLAVLAVAPLALRLSPNRWAAVGAVLVAGLLASMPNYYLNWSRYTQLAGQVILPAALVLGWRVLESSTGRRPLLTLAWLAWGGLALTHFRVLIFAVLYIGLVYVAQVIWRRGWTATEGLLMLGAGAGLLFLPWFLRVFGGQIMAILGTQLSTPPGQVSDFTREYNTIGQLTTYLSWPLWVLALLASVWALWRRRWDAVLMGGGWLGVILSANPDWIGLPGVGAIGSFTVFIASYLPAAALIGMLLGELGNLSGAVVHAADRLAARLQPQLVAGRLWSPTLAGLVLAAGLWGARQRLADLRVADHAMVTRPDLQAMAWVQTHTDPEARFLVNSFFAYGGSSIVGSDAGWWLPLLAGRATTLPPITYSVEHSPVRPDYREWINALTAAVERDGLGAPSTLAMLRERGVTHIFIGQRRGRVGYLGPGPLDPRQIESNPAFRVIYHVDQVWIFAIGE